MLIRNSWYVAAWSEEVGHGRPYGRTIVDEPIVMYRTSVGDVVALEGRCAHRHMPQHTARLSVTRWCAAIMD
jgi:phenylpropionate dioxygenase-like ring-hydroxylating dioxygenase large terminal subunit